jgi:pimeloyl-ACP methyl ester carboxylesterase
MKRLKVSSHSIPSSSGGAIVAHIFEPDDADATNAADRETIVMVHPWSALGGGEHNTIGLARRIVGIGGRRRWRAVTFALESDPAWRGGPLWGILSNHSHEVGQIVDVVNWVRKTYRRVAPPSSSSSSDGGDGGSGVALFGSSAGAPMAGTAMARLKKDGEDPVLAYVAVGYTFGNLASLAFGRHFANLAVADNSSSTTPMLFVMGERDEFTSVDQLEQMAKRMRGEGVNGGGIVDVEIVPGVGHFELESPGYDELVARTVLDWLDKIPA